MKTFVNKIKKNLIIILVIMTIISSLLPSYAYAATDTANGGRLLNPIVEFVVFLCDEVMEWLQKVFVSTDGIENGDGTYNFQYSPAIIFSGTVPALDVNFIDPKEVNTSFGGIVEEGSTIIEDDMIITAEEFASKYSSQYDSAHDLMYDLIQTGEATSNNGEKLILKAYKEPRIKTEKISILLTELLEMCGVKYTENTKYCPNSYNLTNPDNYKEVFDVEISITEDINISNSIYKDKDVEILVIKNFKQEQGTVLTTTRQYTIESYSVDIINWDEMDLSEDSANYTDTYNYINISMEETSPSDRTYESTAAKLQNTIATWYNALRRIALVGLLSVLVYIGIRIVISSSAGDKAKYKEMLKDWLVALCILFTLHYIMNITLTVTNEISAIFTTGETDVLLNDLRAKIRGAQNSWGAVLAEVIMYVVLVIYTCTFTLQYLKRVLYMAFFTLIAPLITLTYPIDKIKDGQAQAFSMWIKEYIFTALTQVIHLVIYFVLVSSALEIVTEYPLYAIIVLTFIKKAEDLIKKMFGFDKAETVGTLGKAAAGGLIMNAISSVKPPKKSSKEGGSNNNIRTAQKDPLASLRASGGAAPTTVGAGNSGSGVSNSGTQNGSVRANSGSKRSIKNGTKAVWKKYVGPSIIKGVKALPGATLGALLGGTGAMIGLSAGIAQGDLGKAATGIMVGGKAGVYSGKRFINGVQNIEGKVKGTVNNIVDAYEENVYGPEYVESIRAMSEAGITDKEDIEKILNSGLSTDDAIGYYTLAQNCPDDLYNDDEKLEIWLQAQGLEETDAKTMKENMKKFR